MDRELDEEFANKIGYECGHGDIEIAHSRADELLCQLLTKLGYQRTVAAWNDVAKWYA